MWRHTRTGVSRCLLPAAYSCPAMFLPRCIANLPRSLDGFMRLIGITRTLLLAAMLGTVPPASAAPVSDRTNTWNEVHMRSSEVLAYAVQLVQDGYARAPAVMAGLAALLLLPPLTLIGVVLQWRRRRAYADSGTPI